MLQHAAQSGRQGVSPAGRPLPTLGMFEESDSGGGGGVDESRRAKYGYCDGGSSFQLQEILRDVIIGVLERGWCGSSLVAFCGWFTSGSLVWYPRIMTSLLRDDFASPGFMTYCNKLHAATAAINCKPFKQMKAGIQF